MMTWTVVERNMWGKRAILEIIHVEKQIVEKSDEATVSSISMIATTMNIYDHRLTTT